MLWEMIWQIAIVNILKIQVCAFNASFISNWQGKHSFMKTTVSKNNETYQY